MIQNLAILETNIGDIIGLNTLTEDEKVAMLRDLGDLVLESALTRLVADLSNEQVVALDQYSDNVTDTETLLKHLFEHYPNFENLLQEEIIAFKEEANSIFANKK